MVSSLSRYQKWIKFLGFSSEFIVVFTAESVCVCVCVSVRMCVYISLSPTLSAHMRVWKKVREFYNKTSMVPLKMTYNSTRLTEIRVLSVLISPRT